jgi:hypothetical protein
MKRTLALIALALGSDACAFALYASTGPTLESTGNVGGEGRAGLRAAAGDPNTRIAAALTTGGGDLARSASGYALAQPSLGVSLGRNVETTLEAFYTARFLFATPTLTRSAIGTSAQVLFRVADTGGEHGGVLIGPRTSIEYLWGADREPDRAIASLSFVVEWITLDTTGNRWF